MERLLGLRPPLTVAALTMLSLVALARLGLGLSEIVGVGGSTAVAAARLSPNAGDAALTVVVGVLLVSCSVGPAVARRRAFAVWTVVLALASVLATVMALALTDLEVAGWSLVWLIPDVSVPLLVGLVGAVLARGEADPDAGRPHVAATAVEPEEEPAAPESEPDPELQPAWTQDAAAGAVWRTAGEAARGAPALGWGTGSTAWSDPARPGLDAGGTDLAASGDESAEAARRAPRDPFSRPV